MNITLNGEQRAFDEPLTVAQLVTKCELTPDRVAVEVNEQVVRRAKHSETALRDGDRVEIVTLVGGG